MGDVVTRGLKSVIARKNAGGVADFIFEVRTTTPSETFTLPLQNATTNLTIEWGDGNSDNITTYNDADLAHTYTTIGTYYPRILSGGIWGGVKFNNAGDKLKIYDISNWGDLAWSSCAYAFNGCTNLVITATDTPDFSSVTGFNRMMQDCTSLTTVAAALWDTSSATVFEEMFSGCTSLTTIDVSSWNVSSVSGAWRMFRNCSSLTGVLISGWNVSSVTNFDSFSGANSALSTSDYSAALIYWDGLTLQSTVTANFGTVVQYTSGAAAAARASIVSGDTWSITDGGLV